MRLVCRFSIAVGLTLGQTPEDLPPLRKLPPDTQDRRLPNGKSQRDEIIKEEHKKNLQDAAQLAKLSGEINEELEKSDPFVVSLKTIKKLEDIEKLSKDIRGRLKRY
jgi:hypothetical protein